ncbi:MAG: hypothetical protein SWK90_06105 [Chloroflexota bacterium]|nr:hypothetical protein [Chloroflexota bacterium]
MRTKVCASAAVLILTILACALPGTPTPDSGAVDTAVAQTMQAKLATDEPTDTPAPDVTGTILPAATDTPTPSTTPHAPATTLTPTATPTGTPIPCPIAVASEFEPRINVYPDVLLALGCPTTERLQTWAVEERFEYGRMFWQQDTDMIHIVYDDGTFQMELDGTVAGAEKDDYCPEVGDVPAGLFKPVRGFNWQWCNNDSVRNRLRWALEVETGYNTLWQEFEHGHVFRSLANHIFVFYDDETWGYIE